MIGSYQRLAWRCASNVIATAGLVRLPCASNAVSGVSMNKVQETQALTSDPGAVDAIDGTG